MACIVTRCKLSIPIDLIPAQESEIDPSIRRRLDVGKLRLGPVFVVADIDVGFRVEQQSRISRGFEAGDVADVVPVLLEPIDRGVFLSKEKILWSSLISR